MNKIDAIVLEAHVQKLQEAPAEELEFAKAQLAREYTEREREANQHLTKAAECMRVMHNIDTLIARLNSTATPAVAG